MIARLMRELDRHDESLLRLEFEEPVPALTAASRVVEACSGPTLSSAREVRKNLSATEEITSPAFLVALEACRADGEPMAAVLASMEANRVMVPQPRFGPATAAKARAALERFEAIAAAARAAEATLAARAPPEAPQEAPKAPAVPDVRPAAEKATIALLDAEAGRLARLERERGVALRMEESRRFPRGPAAWSEALARAMEDEAGALADLVEAILEKPDDQRRRRLRCDNEAFRRDLDRPATLAALYALGFDRLVVEGEECLVLAEPDPAVDLDRWCQWFDQLKANKGRLEKYLAERGWTEAVEKKRKIRQAEPPPWERAPG